MEYKKNKADLLAMIDVAALWRQTVTDAVYTQPINPVPGTAGEGGRFTGTYSQLRFD